MKVFMVVANETEDFKYGIHDRWVCGIFEDRDAAIEAIRKKHEGDKDSCFSVNYGPETVVTIRQYEEYDEDYQQWNYDELYYVLKEVELNKLY